MRIKLSILLPAFSGILLALPWLIQETGFVLLFAFVPLFFAEFQLSRLNQQREYPFFGIFFFSFLLWNLLATWWITWVSFFGMVFIVTTNSLLMAGVWWLAGFVSRKFDKTLGYLSLVSFWIAYEFLLNHCEIPWPWLVLGNGFAWSAKIIQWYQYTGVTGGSFWVLLSNIFLFETLQAYQGKRFKRFASWSSSSLATILIPILISVGIYFNYQESGSSVRIMAVQPNVDPYTEKFNGLSQKAQLQRIVGIIEANITDSVDLVVAPETSLPDACEDSLRYISGNTIYSLIDKHPNLNFLGGALTTRKTLVAEQLNSGTRKSDDSAEKLEVFNSSVLFSSDHKIQINHKNLLVNGVERMPFQKYLSFLNRLSLDLGGASSSLTAGERPVIFVLNDSLKIGSVICFESVFGEYTSKVVSEGAGCLVVLTNDGWWKESAGVWQHFGYARIRAIENRRSIVHSANTGISGFINQRGDILKKTGINEQTAVISKINVNTTNTFYTSWGDFVGRIFVLLSGVIVVYLAVLRIYFRSY